MVDFTREDVMELIRKVDPTLTLAAADFEENAFIASTDSIFDYSVGVYIDGERQGVWCEGQLWRNFSALDAESMAETTQAVLEELESIHRGEL